MKNWRVRGILLAVNASIIVRVTASSEVEAFGEAAKEFRAAGHDLSSIGKLNAKEEGAKSSRVYVGETRKPKKAKAAPAAATAGVTGSIPAAPAPASAPAASKPAAPAGKK